MDKLVITGYGIKCPNGYNNEHFRKSLEGGNFQLSYFHSSLGKSLVVGRVPDDQLVEFSNTSYSRVTRLGLAAAKEAIAMANIPTDGSVRVAVVIGSAAGPTDETMVACEACANKSYRKYPLLSIGLMSYHSISSAIVGEFGLDAKALTLITGCNSSADALYVAKLLLLSQQVDICIVGGSEAPISEVVLYGGVKLQIAAADISMEEAGVPFSGRDKFIISEGAGVIVLERDGVATRRKARSHGELLGIETNNDGMSANNSDGSGTKMKKVVESVLNGLNPTYLNSQALGLKINDEIDLAVRKSVLGGKTPITSIKGVTGHAFGSAGIIQVIASLISLEYGFIPKTKSNDFTRTLDVVTDTIYTPIRSVCITSHGFGGNNSCILVGSP